MKRTQLLVIVVAVLVAGIVLYAWIRPSATSPNAQWCLALYDRAVTASDTATTDLLTPPNSAPPIACGVLRMSGRLQDRAW